MSRQKIARWPAVDSVNGTRSLCMPLRNMELIPASPMLGEVAGLRMRNAVWSKNSSRPESS